MGGVSMEFLNEYSGLFSLLAVVASIVSIVVSVMIYRKQKNDHLQDLKDEYEAIEKTSIFPMSIAEKEYYSRKNYLEKKLRRK
jgi:mannitol-specific phosphotransferase system IIBC component